MKRFFSIILAGILLLCTCGCEPTTPKSVVMKGYPYMVSEGNDMTVIDAFVEGNSIVVKVSVDFASATPADLTGITVHKMEVEQPDIPCDLEKTAKYNESEDIFTQETVGKQEFFLVFTDSSVGEDTELSNYILAVPVGSDSEGNTVLDDAIALG